MRDGSFHGHPDHDACGTGLIVHLGQPASHEVVDRGLVALQRLAHRGGVDADGASGDGAGLLTQIPQRFIRRCAEELGIGLPRVFGMGMLFLPVHEGERARVRRELEQLATDRGLRWLGWREVPVNHGVLGARAAETAPSIWQCFLSSPTPQGLKPTDLLHSFGTTESRALIPSGAKAHFSANSKVPYKPIFGTRFNNNDYTDNESDQEHQQLEAELFLFRKRAETALGRSVYFCSLSSRTVVYKGLLSPWQLPLFYPDLDSPDFESQFVLFHQRFSTNTEPSWSLAQPFRFLAHNGEINTIVGNRRWMHAREMALRREQHPDQWFHALEEYVSDSASLDNALELLVRQGYGLESGLLSLTPPAFESNSRLGPFIRNFLEGAAHEYEPWDGPAALVFSDGRLAGAKLDRNGLRPLRYTRTANGLLVLGSEAGIADLEGKEIVERGRLGPGEMLVVDLATGDLIHGDELLESIAENQEQNQNPPLRHGDTEKNLGSTAEVAKNTAQQSHKQNPFNHTFATLSAGSGHEGTRSNTELELTAEVAKDAEDRRDGLALVSQHSAYAKGKGILTTEGTEDNSRKEFGLGLRGLESTAGNGVSPHFANGGNNPGDLTQAIHLPVRTGDSGARGLTDPKRLAAALGWTQDQVRILLQPLAEGREAVWSMGDDAPPAFMSKLRRTLWDYCKQRFAQVTNPPIDPFRESHVMSLRVRLGRGFVCESPVLDSQQLEFLRRQACGREIDITFAAADGVTGALAALERIKAEASVCNLDSRSFVLLSDRNVNEERAALPVLLATSFVWKAMVNAGNYRTPLIVETAQAFDTHHVALLLAVGATAVVPFLAMRFAEEHEAPGVTSCGAANYCRGIDTGLKKVLSRMGISTIASYRNGQLFETIGLDRQLCGEFFESATHIAGEASLEQVLEDYLHNHAVAFGGEQANLRDAGLFRYRKQGEQHETSPDLLRKLHAHVETRSAESYSHLEELGWKREPIAIRDLMEFVPQPPVLLDEVESESEILRRFSTQAMSLGAISPEAHRTLALAMNRLGARSNTGEGGEDPDLYTREPEAANKIKQIASGRFGVTAEYLVNAQEIEIKIAQGSKPGEGGQLPASKVTPYIAKLRHAVPGMSLISPPPHHDIYSIEDLAQLIHDLREVNPQARIGVKLVAGAGIGVIAAGVAKAGADVITVSGHNGGTGASPLSSIKNTALPWEFGLQDVHCTLVKAGLRQRVRLRVDGGLKFARDVVIAALLGADEFGFGTAALLAMGCVMARQCHLNTCPVGIATQDESLRTRFTGNPEMVIAYFQSLVAEVRVLLATLLGARTLEEIVGRKEKLRPRETQLTNDWVRALLQPVEGGAGGQVSHKEPNGLARQLAGLVDAQSERRGPSLSITNADLSVGAHLSGEMLRRWNSEPLEFEFYGIAGQSFGAFLVSGISFRLWGEANDYVAKGLSGGSIAISAGHEASLRGDVLAGNTLLYGATSGELFIAGRAGERFAVRNSGALAVVEGLGDHGCEYMTGGVVLVLGSIGMNFGSGMTGGLAYALGEHLVEYRYNREFVRIAPCSPEEELALRQVLARHFQLTESPRAARLLNSESRLPLVRVQPATLPCSVEETWATVWSETTGPEVAVASCEVSIACAEPSTPLSF